MEILGIFIPTWFIVIVVLLITAYFYYTWRFSELAHLGINHPKPFSVLGTFRGETNVPFHELFVNLVKKYGKVCGCYQGRNPNLVIADPDILKQILVKKFTNFQDRQYLAFRGILRYSVFDINGAEWKRIRALLTPAFSAGKLKQMKQLINDCTKTLLKNIGELCDEDKEFEAKDMASAYTMDVIGATAFGCKLESQKGGSHPFLKHARKSIDAFVITNPLFYIMSMTPFLIPILEFLGVSLMSGSSEKYFKEFVEQVLKERKSESASHHVDLIQLMLEAEKNQKGAESENMSQIGSPGVTDHQEIIGLQKGLTHDEIVSQCTVFLLAGYDTTATTLSFLWYNLAVNPQCQDRVIREVDEVLQGREPDYDLVSKLEYMQMCIDETLRLFGAVSSLDRLCVEETQIEGYDLRIPKGYVVVVPIRAIHMDPEIWDDPEKFDPERFTPEAKASRHPYTYFPFGQGPRNCIGMRLALMEIKMAMAKLLQSFRLIKCSNTQIPVKLANSLFVKAENGLWIKAARRTDLTS